MTAEFITKAVSESSILSPALFWKTVTSELRGSVGGPLAALAGRGPQPHNKRTTQVIVIPFMSKASYKGSGALERGAHSSCHRLTDCVRHRLPPVELGAASKIGSTVLLDN